MPPRRRRPQPWATFTTTVPLVAGTNSIEVVSTTPNSFDLGIDTLAVGPAGSPPPSRRRPGLSEDGSAASTPTPTTTTRPAAPDSPAPPARPASSPSTPTGCWTPPVGACSTTPRARCGPEAGGSNPGRHDGDVEDGYLFAYGHDYAGALHTLAQLTGPAPLLPRDVFGVWYSDYTPYSSSDIENSVYPAFVSQQGPAQHALPRHRLEGAERLERLGVERLALPRRHRPSSTGRAPTASTSP